MSTPNSQVKSKFESKEKLVAAVKALATDDLWVPRLSSDRGGSKGLEQVSNAKLIKLHATFSAVKEKFGTRAKLIDAVIEAEGRAKDSGYRTRLEGYAVPRLYDLYTAKARKSGAAKAGRKAPAKAATKKAGTKKAGTKKAGTKKAGTKKAGTKKAGTKKAAG
ncbi:MAG: hypothetical protein FJ096_17560 [Deltaproteobacteria bacterium]|nr:hypothetical protein [Deltaproteobacteria bacterium]